MKYLGQFLIWAALLALVGNVVINFLPHRSQSNQIPTLAAIEFDVSRKSCGIGFPGQSNPAPQVVIVSEPDRYGIEAWGTGWVTRAVVRDSVDKLVLTVTSTIPATVESRIEVEGTKQLIPVGTIKAGSGSVSFPLAKDGRPKTSS